MESDGPTIAVRRGDREVCTIGSKAAEPVLRPEVTFLSAGDKGIRSALLFPGGKRPAEPLPVLLDPYGGPHFQRVVRARPGYLVSQWLAAHGFAVLVADGRGTPGRGSRWGVTVRG